MSLKRKDMMMIRRWRVEKQTVLIIISRIEKLKY